MAKAKSKKPTDIVPMMVRMREGLRRKLARIAEENGHSINAEINFRLELSFTVAESEKRDTAIVDMLAGPSSASRGLLRRIIWELQRNPLWASSPSGEVRDLLAAQISEWIRNPSFHFDTLEGFHERVYLPKEQEK